MDRLDAMQAFVRVIEKRELLRSDQLSPPDFSGTLGLFPVSRSLGTRATAPRWPTSAAAQRPSFERRRNCNSAHRCY